MRKYKNNMLLIITTIVILLAAFLVRYFINSNKNQAYGVSGENPLAVEVGMEVLRQGGNAADAAVAISYVLGVVQPFGSGIGGGGAMLIYPQDGRAPVFYDYLETAPSNLKKGAIGKSGVPGFVKGMEEINKEYGTINIKTLMEPAIGYAEKGFQVDRTLSKALVSSRKKLFPTSAEDFFPQGKLVSEGTMIKQPKLANTLKRIQRDGAYEFYLGEIGQELAGANIGLELEDLKNYEVVKRKPIIGTYGEYDIVSAPPPFSGISLIQILKLTEKLHINSQKGMENELALLSNTVGEVYKDREKYIADPNFETVDSKTLLSEKNIRHLQSEIVQNDQQDILYFNDVLSIPEDTTHFVVIDKNGMMVSCTNSLSSWFGTGRQVEGFFLNNHLKNFSHNSQSINNIVSGKRPRTFMAPTIIVQDKKPVLTIGSPGGNKIPIMLVQVIIDILNNNNQPRYAVNKPRFYIKGNTIQHEDGFQIGKSNQKIYKIISNNNSLDYGAVSCLLYDYANNQILGGADSRRGGVYRIEKLKKKVK